ncbi:MAG: glycoside hydrolase domain-containing protein [Anaerolineaceae bacterium]
MKNFHPLLLKCFQFLMLVVLIFLPIQPLPAHAQTGSSARAMNFARVGAQAGWLQIGNALYWTPDGAAWTDITPALDGADITAAFFLDETQGWLAASGSGSDALFHTADGGVTWDRRSLDLFTPQDMARSGEGWMQWLTPETGWVLFKQATGVNFSLGLLFKTTDGGGTWTRLTAPLGEPFHFTSEFTGWMAGGPDGGRLFQTADGGATWLDQSAQFTAAEPGARSIFTLPTFTADGAHGVLPVLQGESGKPGALRLYTTSDGGVNWQEKLSQPLSQEAADQTVLTLPASGGDGAALILPSENMLLRADGSTAQGSDAAVSGLTDVSMADSLSGWGKQQTGDCTDGQCVSTTRLLRTDDGGATWQPLVLPDGSAETIRTLTTSSQTLSPSADAGILGVSNTAIYTGHGFDTCELPSLSALQNWWSSSPYRVLNLYIGGSMRYCDNTALTASTLKQLNAQGWKFIPTWVGPQPPCSGYTSTFSYDTTTAYNEGVAEAQKAADALRNLLLTFGDGSGSVVYYDLEAFTTNTTCSSATKAFLNGWTAQLHNRGQLSGLYGSPYGSRLPDYFGIPNPPDLIWAAVWSEDAYTPGKTVWGLPAISDSIYKNHQRILQYTGGHDETWGGKTLNIDSDVLDGVVAQYNNCPIITYISPGVVQTGSPAFTLTVQGINFVTGSVIRLDGLDTPTTFVSPTRLTASVAASRVASAGSINVTATSTYAGCSVSNTAKLSIFDQIFTTRLPVIYR